MQYENDTDDYNLRVMIEEMQQRGSSEREIEAAVRSASRRLEHELRPTAHRPRRLRGIGRRVVATVSR